MAIRKGNKRRKTTFRKARGYGMRYRPNTCSCNNCQASPWGMDEVVRANKIRRLNKAREEVHAND